MPRIYITDIDKGITESDLVACVPVKEMLQLLKRMDEINAKMQEVVDKYANSIKF